MRFFCFHFLVAILNVATFFKHTHTHILFCIGYSWLAILWQFQVSSKGTQPIGIHVSILTQTPLLSRLPQNIEQSSLLVIYCKYGNVYCVKCCNILNPAPSLLLPYKGEPHDCEKIIVSLFVTLRSDLHDTPLTNPKLILFVDGTYCRSDYGNFQAGYAITIQKEPLERESLPHTESAQ